MGSSSEDVLGFEPVFPRQAAGRTSPLGSKSLGRRTMLYAVTERAPVGRPDRDRFGEGKVRVRLTESIACLTIKGPREGISRPERKTLRTFGTCAIDGLDWTIDVYMGPLKEVVLAEVELEHPSKHSHQLQKAL
jgi:hypothetical protein